MFFSFQKRNGSVPINAGVVSPATTRTRSFGGSSVTNHLAKASGFNDWGIMSENSNPGNFTHNRFLPLAEDPLERSVMEQWIPKSQFGLMALYRKIHLRDNIAGPITDMMANMPFSDWVLVGDMTREASDVYNKSAEQLNLEILMPELCVEFLSIGRSINSLIFDDKDGTWKDILSLPAETCWIEPRYVRGFDPKINFIPHFDIKRWALSQDPRDKEAHSGVNPKFLEMLRRGTALPLNPLTTMYIPRKSHPNDMMGTSWYSRLLPLFILDQILTSGTLVGAYRKQSGLVHVKMGSDVWEPSPEEREAVGTLVQSSDEDPIGSVIVTNRDVDINEIGQRQLWKIEDSWGFLSSAKLKSLGIGEAFLSSEANYNSQNATLSVFIENIRNIRDTISYRVFDQKLFPILARVHGFIKRPKSDLDHNVRTRNNPYKDKYDIYLKDQIKNSPVKSVREKLKKERDLHQLGIEQNKKQFASYEKAMSYDEVDLQIPKVQWTKQLAQLASPDILSTLQTLAGQEIPVPLATWLSAAGLDVASYHESLKQDIADQETIKFYKSKLPEDSAGNKDVENDDTDGDYGQGMEASLKKISSKMPQVTRHQMKQLLLEAIQDAKNRGPLKPPAGVR